jgi:signal transduction histidine kinase
VSRLGRKHGLDALIAVLALALQVFGLRARSAQPPEMLSGAAAGVLLALAQIGQAVSLLLRRTRPIWVLGACLAGYVVNFALVPGVPPYAGWFALYAAGVYTRPTRRATFVATAGTVAFCAVVGIGAVAYPATVEELVLLLVVTGTVALLAALTRARRAQLDALRQRAAALEREQETAVARAEAEERLRIARELHDVVGHGMSAIAVQSSTARLALDAGRFDQARTALSAIESTSRAAMREMRQLLSVLRGDEADPVRAPGLPDLPGFLAQIQANGVSASLTSSGLNEVPNAISVAAYRLVQEAVTNAVKHAPGGRISIEVNAGADAVVVMVDNFVGATGRAPEYLSGGHGLIGMRERVASFGGQLTVGPAEHHSGWRVRARIPFERGAPE